MSEIEYKVVAAPQRAKKQAGVKGREDRFALTVQEVINRESTGGWRYLRTDHFPTQERSSWFSRPQAVNHSMMVFARAKEAVARSNAAEVRARAPRPEPVAAAERPVARPVAAPPVETSAPLPRSHPEVGGASRD